MNRIILAEDEPDLRNFLSDELRNKDFVVTAVDNGADAVVADAEGSFDLALLDMMMPGLNGVQSIRVLKRIMPELPIIALTGYVGRGYMAEAMAYGVTCFAKPVDMQELLTEINSRLNGKS